MPGSNQSQEPAPTARRLVAIGNFDGVHLGHQALLRRVVESATEAAFVPAVLTFDPHPSAIVGGTMQPTLTVLARKVALIRGLHPRLEVCVHPFDAQLAAFSPRKFAELLVSRYRAASVIVGQNFRFGKGRSGHLETLQALGRELGFSASATELLAVDGEVISSSRIRAAVADGNVTLATRLLGRPHSLSGVVVEGDRLGRKLGYPTANLEPAEMLPARGVYAVLVHGPQLNGVPAVANIGVRPTLNGARLGVEVHVLDFAGDLYGAELRVELVHHIRSERRFDGLESLRLQIAQDAREAERLLAREE